MKTKPMKYLYQFIIAPLKAAENCDFRLGRLLKINTLGYILKTMRAMKGKLSPSTALFYCAFQFICVSSLPIGTNALKHRYGSFNYSKDSEGNFIVTRCF